jgi:transcription elongation factor GreA
MGETLYLTSEGAERLKIELDQLRNVERPKLALRLRSAIQEGDLSENADYHKAKEDQGFLEGRIQELEYLFKNAVIVENGQAGFEVVNVGATVTVQEEDEDPETYVLVGVKEADSAKRKISYESPVGKALMGKKAGDIVSVETPGGSFALKILKVE